MEHETLPQMRRRLLQRHCVRLGLVRDDDPTTPSPSKLAKAIEKSTQYVSDLLRGGNSFGDKAARHVEEKLQLEMWTLDGGGSDWPFRDIDRSRFDRLSEAQQAEIAGAVRALIIEFESTAKPVLAKRGRR